MKAEKDDSIFFLFDLEIENGSYQKWRDEGFFWWLWCNTVLGVGVERGLVIEDGEGYTLGLVASL